MELTKKRKSQMPKSDLIFYICLIVLPIIQIIIFYFAVNIKSILMAFQRYDTNTYSYVFNGFNTFKEMFSKFGTNLIYGAQNSLLSYAIGLVISTPLHLLFSYYVYKNSLGGGFFKVMLFIPTIIPATTMCSIYLELGNKAWPIIGEVLTGTPFPQLGTMNRWGIFFFITILGMIIGFGANIIMYTSAMSGIDQSLVEACEIDGASPMQEFLHVTMPMIWPTFATFVTVGVAAIFQNQMHLFTLFGSELPQPDIPTIGYILFAGVANADGQSLTIARMNYPNLAAQGLFFTLIAIPMVYGVKALLAKIGPKVY